MRSILLLLGTLLLAVGGFVAYRVFQPVPARIAGQTVHEARAVDLKGNAPRVGLAADGVRPWIRNIDRQGRLASRFKADEYLPQGGGRVHVIHPQAEFFQYPSSPSGASGAAGAPGREQRVQRIAIEARTGDMEVQQPSQSAGAPPSSGSGQGGFEKGSSGPPKRGRLKDDVTIRVYPDAYGPRKDEPSITLVTDNMSFDNETFEVSTAATTGKDGKVIPADEVPITVTGDYEFQGRGLKLRWNDLEGRLEYLEVAHGDFLTILHPGGANGNGGSSLFGGGEANKPAAAPASPQPVVAAPAVATAAPAPAAGPAAAGPAPVGGARPSGKAEPAKGSHHGPQPPYVATFERDVHVSQGERGVSEKQLATADRMTIDFLTGQSKATTQPSTAPAAGPGAAPGPVASNAPNAPASPVSPVSPVSPEPTPAVAMAAPGAGPATAPTTGPSMHPSDLAEAVTVRWMGTLHVVPIESAAQASSLKPGESIVHLFGEQAPVHVTRDGNDVRCARLDYRSPDGNAALYNSPAFPQVVLRQLAAPGPQTRPATGAEANPPGGASQPDEAVIVTEAIDYSGADRVAVLHGVSEAQVQLKPDPSEAPRAAGRTEPDVLDVKWQKLARIYFLDRANSARSGESSAAPGTAAAPKKAAMPGAQQLAVDHAHFEGDVKVWHPQLVLDSLALDAEFDPAGGAPGIVPASAAAPVALADASAGAPFSGALPTTRPADTRKQANLRRLVATDAVTCQVTDEAGKKQNIECRQMVMDTGVSPLGKLYPKKIDFDGGPSGDAHAFDPTQDVKAAHIQATFLPVSPSFPATGPSAAPSAEPAVATAAPAANTAVVDVPAPGGAAAGPAPAGPATKPARAGPSTRPAELDTVTATGRVRVATADGALATADRMFVKMVDGSPHARLTGTPAGPGVPAVPARVVDAKKNVVVGPVITADPKQNTAAVEGPGTMHLIRQESPAHKPTTGPSLATGTPSRGVTPTTGPADQPSAEKSRPIDVTFKSGAVMDSANNVIDVRDAVSVVSTDPDGTVNTANGQHVHITLADKPPGPARPPGAAASQPAAAGAGTAGAAGSAGPAGPAVAFAPGAGAANLPATQPSTRPAKGDKSDVGSMDVMKGKVVTGVVLEKDAVVKSSLTDGLGAVLREFELKSELIRYDLSSTQPGAKGKIIVPVPGQMLIRDHRPPGANNAPGSANVSANAAANGAKGTATAIPAASATSATPATAAPAGSSADAGQSRGATAFQWSKDLTYDETTYTAVLTGDVWIVHQDDDPKSEPARLRADRVVAVFEPRSNPAAKSARAPGAAGGSPAEPTASLQLKWMTATGNVSVTRAGSTLNAPRMDYDPVSGWMTALGTDRVPASYADAEGVNSCTAHRIDWNAQTWNVKFKDILTRTGRRQPGG